MLEEKKHIDEPLEPVPSYPGEVQEGSHDAVFGEINGDGPNYRNVRFSSVPSTHSFYSTLGSPTDWLYYRLDGWVRLS